MVIILEMLQRMSILDERAQELGVRLTPFQLDQFEVYFKELADWNNE